MVTTAIIMIVILVVLGAIGTILIGLSPQDNQYGTKTKKNLSRLTLFYVLATLIFIGIFIYIFS